MRYMQFPLDVTEISIRVITDSIKKIIEKVQNSYYWSLMIKLEEVVEELYKGRIIQ